MGDQFTPLSCASGHATSTCTLREAITLANADTGHVDAIIIPAAVHVVLTQSSVINVTNSMVISGGTGSSVNGDLHQIFNISSNAAVSISGLKLFGGTATNGGAIYCSTGALVLTNDVVSGNTAPTGDGGGLYTSTGCALWVDSSSFVGNNVSTGNGGAMYLEGSAVIVRSTIGGATNAAGNIADEGGGIYNNDGNVQIINSTISHNMGYVSYSYGAGIYNDEAMTISGSAVTWNMLPTGGEGGGIYNDYEMRLENSSVSHNSIIGANDAYGAGMYDCGDITSLAGVDFVGNSSHPNSSDDIYGGAVYSSGTSFTWHNGSISGTSNGTLGESNYIEGGAMYMDPDHVTIVGVNIDSTVNQALPSQDVYGGAIYNDDSSYSTYSHMHISGTTNSATYLEGGAINNELYASYDGIWITGTSNNVPYASGGEIDGGAVYNDSYMTVDGMSVTSTTDKVSLAALPTPSTVSSKVYGGAIYTDDYFTANALTILGVSVRATGGNSFVEGGGFRNDEVTTLNNTEIANVSVQADQYVQGGLLDNNDYLNSTNLTLGNGLVRVLGSVDATSPFIGGSIIYNTSQANLVNATLANVTSDVAGSGQYDSAVYNDSQLQISSATIANDTVAGPHSGLIYQDGGRTSFLNSIVASADPTRNCVVGSGVIQSVGYNIDSGTSCHFAFTGDMSHTNPKVLALANNGGPLMTAALMSPGSPAIDHGSNVGCPPSDARGVTRPQGGTCDIGAFEVVTS